MSNNQGPKSSHRPTLFVPSSQLSSRGPLIMPANNQIQASNLNLFYHPQTLTSPASVARVNLSDQIRSAQVENRTSELLDASSRSSLPSNIELALRQAYMDENNFQPVSAMVTPDVHSVDWSPRSSVVDAQEPQVDRKHLRGEQSSNALKAPETSSTSEPQVSNSADREQMDRSSAGVSQNEYPSSGPFNVQQPQLNSSQQAELSNQVVYEGAATVASSNDYYFSSAEKLPNSGRASNAWW